MTSVAERGVRVGGMGRVVETLPLRNPDSSNPQVMGRRAWWLLAMNILVPGSAQVLAGNRRLGRFGLGATLLSWLMMLCAGGTFIAARSVFIGIATNWFALTAAQIFLIGYAILWIVLTLDTVRLLRLVRLPPLSRIAVPVVALLIGSLLSGGAVYASTIAASSRGTLGAIFGASGPSLPPSDGFYNILLLGADSGEGRDSLRFDSISVVSVNAATGAATITGIPRELPGVPFSEGSPMHELYPDGFQGHDSATCGWEPWMNQIRNAAQICREDQGASLYPEAAGHGSEPGIEATKDAAEGILGIEIPYYVFIDMDGFADLIDALGGVQITVKERLPEGGGPAYPGQPAEEWATGWIEPGAQTMDGETAQWYARSRYTTSDWDRMQRQRELQIAVLQQFTPQTVLTRFNELAAAGQNLVSTDLPQGKLPEFFDLVMKAKDTPVTTIELTPDNGVSETEPDFTFIRGLVDDALHPPTATPTPAP